MTEEEWQKLFDRLKERHEMELHKMTKSRDNWSGYGVLISIVAAVFFLLLCSK